MNNINNYSWLNSDEKIAALEKENASLEDQIIEMQEFFDVLSVPIIKQLDLTVL